MKIKFYEHLQCSNNCLDIPLLLWTDHRTDQDCVEKDGNRECSPECGKPSNLAKFYLRIFEKFSLSALFVSIPNNCS